jgi:hypothetical protein
VHYYKVSAEHVNRLDIGRAADAMEHIPGVLIMAAGRDEVFDRCGVWIVCSEQDLGNQLQDIVWRYNNGAWCEQTKIDFDIAESYC